MTENKYSILIIDDDVMSNITLERILAPSYNIYTATNGYNGLLEAEKILPDVILLDIIMEGMDGYEVITELKNNEKTRDIPVIFLTAHSDTGGEEKGLYLGAADYITKPYSPAIVKFRVYNQVRQLEQFREAEQIIMKHRLTNSALGVASWELILVDGDLYHPNTKIVFSQDFRNLLGFRDKNEFPNTFDAWRDRLHPDEKDAMRQAIRDHVNNHTGNNPYNVEYRLLTKSGEYRYFHSFGTTQRDSFGVPLMMVGGIRDVDERIQTQNRLAIMSSIVHNSPNFISYKKISGECLYVNPAATIVTGYSQEELMTDYLGKVLGANAQVYSKHVADELSKNGMVTHEYAGRKKDGVERIFEGTTFLIDKEAFATIATDVTDMRRNEYLMQSINSVAEVLLTVGESTDLSHAIEESMEITGLAVNADRIHIWRCNKQGDSKSYSNEFCWTSNIAKQKTMKLYGFEFQYSVMSEWQELFEKGIHIEGSTLNFPQDARDYFNNFDVVSIAMVPIFLNDKFWGLFIVDDCKQEHKYTDHEISSLKSISLMIVNTISRNAIITEINEANERLLLMLDTSPLCTQIWDRNLNTVECNEAAVRLYGFKNKQEYVEKFIEHCSPEFQPDGQRSDEKAVDLVNKAFEEGYCKVDWMHKMPFDDSLMPAEVTLVRAKYKDGYVVAGYTQDLRGYHKMIEEMRKSEIAEESNKAKSAFLANMSHEIRTPINAVMGITDILLQDEKLPDKIADGLGRIRNSGDLLLGIINDVLDLSKVEAGKMDIVPAEYSIASLIYDSIQMNMIRLNDKPIEFDVNIDKNLPIGMIGDELRVKQILNNVLSNAFKYTDAGKVTLSVHSEYENDATTTLVLGVRDTGGGLSKEQIDSLFEEYSRFNKDYSRGIEGTGLGLTITRFLIDLMGGSITVESEPGIGSLFTMRIPQGVAGTEVLGEELADNLRQARLTYKEKRKKPKLIRDPMPYGSVLIVDDVETNLYVADGLMKPYYLEIDTVMSGFAAIDRVNEGKTYDIIFMDHMMPKMDGIETVKHLREIGYTNPIVALTANALVGQADVFLQNGFDDFISKPIDIHILDSILNNLIRDKYPEVVVEAARLEMKKSAEEADDTKSVMLKPSRASDGVMQYREIEGLDIVKGLERYGGNDKVYLQILRSFTASMRSMIETIRTVDYDDLLDYKIVIHGIKGSCYEIFAQAYGDTALELETAAGNGDTEFIKENNQSYLDSLLQFMDNVDEVIINIDTKHPKPKKDAPDKEMIIKLLDACKVYRMDAVNEAMEEIEMYEYESKNYFVKWLRENVDSMNFTQIVERLESEQ